MGVINNLPVVTSEDSFYSYLQKVNSIPSLSAEEEFMLAVSFAEKEDVKAAHRLVTSHLKLVVKIAISYRNYGLPVSELVSEGNMGLMHAVTKYRPELGFRLSTYAIWWIKAAIQDYVLKSWSLVKIGTTAAQKKLFFNLRKIKNKIAALHSRSIEKDDYQRIANELGVTLEEVIEVNQRISNSDLSLNSVINDQNGDHSSELIELVAESRPNQEAILSRRQNLDLKKRVLSDGLDKLNDRERYIIQARRLKESPDTLETLSEHFKVSKERVRQIETRALTKLQQYALEYMKNAPSLICA